MHNAVGDSGCAGRATDNVSVLLPVIEWEKLLFKLLKAICFALNVRVNAAGISRRASRELLYFGLLYFKLEYRHRNTGQIRQVTVMHTSDHVSRVIEKVR